MERRRLGRTDMTVSAICLGTMTWGEQNTEAEAHAQMDLALDHGVDFFDTAEMYPVPPGPATQGRTEAYIGSWFAARGNRDKVVLATKVAGRGRMGHVRGGVSKLDRPNITAALNDSLARLRTDYVDLYQLHWPDRSTNMFGQLGYSHVDEDTVPLEETLGVLGDLVKAGKIRAVGLSNETPWGMMRFLEIAERTGLPRMVSIQNPYSLLNRSFEIGLAEIAIREDCGLLAYSPLAMGMLAGKYRHGARPAGARITLFSRFTRYSSPQAASATEAYLQVADKHGVDPVHMALAFVTTRPFTTSNIIGATSLDQLRQNISSIDFKPTPELLADLETVHVSQPNPAP